MKSSKIIWAIAALALFSAFFAPAPAFALLNNLFNKGPTGAQQMAKQRTQYDSMFPIQDEDSFNAVAKSFHRMPLNDPQLEFDILLPKDWTAEQTMSAATSDLDRKILGDLAHFKSGFMGTMQAEVNIQAIRLEHEITAENWLKNYVLQNGYSIQGKVIPLSERKANVYCTSTTDGKSNFIYATVEFNGSNAIIVSFESPLSIKEPLTFLRQKVVDSFRFIITGERPIEAQKNFSLPDALKFSYPESWTINDQDTRDMNNMSMQLYNHGSGEQVNGMIRFVAVRRTANTDFKKEINTMKTYFDGFLGLEFKRLVSSSTLSGVPPRFVFSRYETYQVKSKKENTVSQELRLVALGDKDWYIFIFMLSPSDTENFYLWACNTQAFDIILRKLR